jgi:hypothetical protein
MSHKIQSMYEKGILGKLFGPKLEWKFNIIVCVIYKNIH